MLYSLSGWSINELDRKVFYNQIVAYLKKEQGVILPKMEPMILVTGATGHIGNVLVREQLERGERVRALVRPRQATIGSGRVGCGNGTWGYSEGRFT
jgi:hypothetical protein